ncbi:MAG: tetratricopeptide repeat protein, partial [Schwartzia sp.]|nr:tetratricopeptide repeat protein [Schwartzia sp. (in: firmicutes)]
EPIVEEEAAEEPAAEEPVAEEIEAAVETETAEEPEAEAIVEEAPTETAVGDTTVVEPMAEEETAEEPEMEEPAMEEPVAEKIEAAVETETAEEPEAAAIVEEAPTEPVVGESTAAEPMAEEATEGDTAEGPTASTMEISEAERDAVLDEIKDCATLDELLDFAYDRKSQRCFAPAIVAYERALSSYQDDPYAPFIVIELGNIYKENGAYDEAIRVYRQALSLPAIQGQSGVEADFARNIDYLDTVSHILAQHDVPSLPFNQIPPGYMQEIESAFADRPDGQSLQQ